MKSVSVSGGTLHIQASKFRKATALKKSVFDALKDNGVNIGLSDITINEKDIFKSDISDGAISKMIGLVLSVGASDEIERALFNCCDGVVMWGSDKEIINEEFFDDPENRKYYYPIMMEVAKVNLMPFFAGLSFLSQGAGKLKELFRK